MSPSEKFFSTILDKQEREWLFHAYKFNLGDTTYQPDFYLPKENLHIEVKTHIVTNERQNKYDKFIARYPHLYFIILYTNRIEQYYDSFILTQPRHRDGDCGEKDWNPKTCFTCKTINMYRRGKRFSSKENILDWYVDFSISNYLKSKKKGGASGHMA